MTDPTTPTPTTPRDARAEAKAAQAYAKAQRPWFKKKRWIISIAIVVLIAIGAGSSGSSVNSSGGGSSSQKSDDGKTGSVGQSVTNAGTTYKVTSARTASTIGDTEFGGGTRADGKFIVVSLDITNNKNETKTFTDSSAKIVTTDGKEYKSSDDAVMAFGDDSLLLKEIQPDLTAHGKLAFDLPPAKVSGAKLVVEDLFGDGEVTIKLGL